MAHNITGTIVEEEAVTQEEKQREQLASYYLAMRADGLSIVSTAERALTTLGYPIQSAIRSRKERRKHKELYDEQPPNL